MNTIRTIGKHISPITFVQSSQVRRALKSQIMHFGKLKNNIQSKKDNLRYQDYSAFKFNYKKSKEPIVAIFIIGESLRSKNLPFYGYERNTMPKLQVIKNLFFFNTLSCATDTFTSIKCFASNAEQKNVLQKINQNYKSFGDILTRLKFDTHWISNQYDSNNDPYKNFHGCLDSRIDRATLRAKGLMDDTYMTRELSNNIEKDTLYILHSRGSHSEYTFNYVNNNAVFKPDGGYKVENLINSYDNTIITTDIFIAQIIEKYKNHLAFIIYSSDHGESIGENGVFGHGADIQNAPSEQINVPTFIWMSDKFIEYNKDKFLNLQKWHQKKQNIMHDNIFHTFLDCLGIRSSIVNKHYSLCSITNVK